jgi:putative transposase
LSWRNGNHPLLTPQPPPVALPADWTTLVNQPQSEGELQDLRIAIHRQRPIGTTNWVETAAKALGVEFSIRPRGRPRKAPVETPSNLPLRQ